MADDRRLIDLPLGNENFTRAAFRALVDEVNTKAAGGLQGLFADRPAAAALLERFIYKATDQGKYYWCDGVGWAEIAGGAELADSAPPAIADAGALGASAQAAREDHTHALHPNTVRNNVAQTFSADQTMAALVNLLFGNGGAILGGAENGDALHILNNCRWSGANWVRRVADNDASRLTLDGNGNLVYYVNTDAGNTVGSVITWGERWRMSKAGLETGVAVPDCEVIYRVDQGDATQNISVNTETIINFPRERLDTHGFHDNATNNSRITIPAGLGGLYIVTVSSGFDDLSADKAVYLSLFISGGSNTDYRENRVGAGGQANNYPGFQITRQVRLDAGAYLQAAIWHNDTTNGTRSLNKAVMRATRIAP